MATQVNKARLCLSMDLGPEVTVNQLLEELAKVQAAGRGHFKVQIDTDQLGDASDMHFMQVFDAEQIVELTHS